VFADPEGPELALIRQGLREQGWIEGENLVYEFHSTDGTPDELAERVSALANLPVDVLVTQGAPAGHAASKATSSIPIVLTAVSDPVQLGLVASFAQPGGNITGVTFVNDDLIGKQMQLFKGSFPWMSRVAALWNSTNPSSPPRLQDVGVAAGTLGLEFVPVEVEGASDFDRAFLTAKRHRADGVMLIPDATITAQRARIVELAAEHSLPAMYYVRYFADAGALMAYGVNTPYLYRRAADYIDRILRGTRPANLPVERPHRFDFVINLRTAQALGLTIPQHVLLQATEVIQ
jgi:putative ABC transport system substrate-binding protein